MTRLANSFTKIKRQTPTRPHYIKSRFDYIFLGQNTDYKKSQIIYNRTPIIYNWGPIIYNLNKNKNLGYI